MILEFGVIVGGTFHWLSWDIMEPLCYLMLLGNFTCSYAFFFAMRQEHDLELSSVHHLLTERFTKKKAIAAGIDLEKHEA